MHAVLSQTLYVSSTDYPIANDYQTRAQNPQPNPQKLLRQTQYMNTSSSFTEEQIWPFSTLSESNLVTFIIYLYYKKFDWCLTVDPIWLVWNTYISHSLTHSTTHQPIYPLEKRKNIHTYIHTHINTCIQITLLIQIQVSFSNHCFIATALFPITTDL